MMRSFFSVPCTAGSYDLLAVMAIQPAQCGHKMPGKTLETKGTAEVSAIQLSNGSGMKERARGWGERRGVLNN